MKSKMNFPRRESHVPWFKKIRLSFVRKTPRLCTSSIDSTCSERRQRVSPSWSFCWEVWKTEMRLNRRKTCGDLSGTLTSTPTGELNIWVCRGIWASRPVSVRMRTPEEANVVYPWWRPEQPSTLLGSNSAVFFFFLYLITPANLLRV